MDVTVTRDEFYNANLALNWLDSERESIVNAIDSVKPSSVVMTDWLLDSPANVAILMKEVAAQAVRHDAPEGVVEGLMVFVRKTSSGSGKLSEEKHVVDTLRSLKGEKNIKEIERAITNAVNTSPSELSTSILQSMANQISGDDENNNVVIMSDQKFRKPFPGGGSGTDSGITPHIPCCSIFCRLCLSEGIVGCAICCLIGQGICML